MLGSTPLLLSGVNPFEGGGNLAGRFRRAATVGLFVLAACTGAAAVAQPSPLPLTASASGRAVSTDATRAPTSTRARRPSITILEPKAGTTVRRSTVRVSVSVKGFEVVDKQFGSPVAREGHVHFYLDVKVLPRTHTYPSPVHYHSISGTAYTWTGVSAGRHTLAVQLVGNDHVPLRPAAKDRVVVTVQ